MFQILGGDDEGNGSNPPPPPPDPPPQGSGSGGWKLARNVIIEDYHKRKRLIPNELIINNHPNAELPDDDENILYDRLYKHILSQSEVCQKLFHEFSQTDNMDQLAEAMNYKSTAGASQQKKRCLDKLYEHIEREDPELAKMLKKRKNQNDDK